MTGSPELAGRIASSAFAAMASAWMCRAPIFGGLKHYRAAVEAACAALEAVGLSPAEASDRVAEMKQKFESDPRTAKPISDPNGLKILGDQKRDLAALLAEWQEAA